MTAIRKYLDYYTKIKKPGFGVLITGAWGVGKTFQVRRALSGKMVYFVSLFGLSSAEQIHASVIASSNPAISKAKNFLKRGEIAAQQVGGAYSLLHIVPNAINARLQGNFSNDATLVFDDLERSSIDTSELLGAINYYIEDLKLKVVVIAHEDKMINIIDDQKEKLFGQTLEAKPETVPAFFSFIKELETSRIYEEDECRTIIRFLRDHRDVIISAHSKYESLDDSGAGIKRKATSLRILRHTLHDLARLYQVLDKTILDNEDSVRQLVREFTIFSIEYRSGRLLKSDFQENWDKFIRERWERNVSRTDTNDRPANKLELVETKYEDFDVDRLILSLPFLNKAILEGIFDASLLREATNSVKPAENGALPAWLKFIKFDGTEDFIVEGAIAELKQQFENREITEPGEILHLISLRFMMGMNGIIPFNAEQIEEQSKKYLDDLLAAGRLPARPTSWRWPDSHLGIAYGGMGYWMDDTYRANFNTVYNYMLELQRAAFENLGEKHSQEIMSNLNTNVEKFYEHIVGDAKDGKFASVPVLHHIDPQEFVENWLALPKKDWRTVSLTLERRYEAGGLRDNGSLVEERDWIINILRILEDKARKESGYRALRIRRLAPGGLPLPEEV